MYYSVATLNLIGTVCHYESEERPCGTRAPGALSVLPSIKIYSFLKKRMKVQSYWITILTPISTSEARRYFAGVLCMPEYEEFHRRDFTCMWKLLDWGCRTVRETGVHNGEKKDVMLWMFFNPVIICCSEELIVPQCANISWSMIRQSDYSLREWSVRSDQCTERVCYDHCQPWRI